MKDDRLFEELKARLDIVDVISDYVELKRAGQNYKGLCPFHSEKTPSFMVSPDKQIFHCFGCGLGGNVINFLMKYENLSFPEALKMLAKKAGINLREYAFKSDDDGFREKLVEIHKEAARVFAENLERSKNAYSYITGRGLTEEAIRTFSLGYAAKDWHYLSNRLREKGFADSLILQSGIASRGDRGIFDTFRDRIMFPICDMHGDTIAFGGRVMDDSQPKYLNSPENPLFKKGETLYGLNLAKEGIRKKGFAMIVEGYFDVLMCHQYGFGNAVAPLGTALTAGHLRKLKRFTKKAVLVFDGDEAGKAAAKRSVPLILKLGFASEILLLPEKDDPDSFLRRENGPTFEKLLSKSKSTVDFVWGASIGDRTERVHEVIGIISSAEDLIMKAELIRELSERAGIREDVIREEMKRFVRRSKEPKGKGEACLPDRQARFSGAGDQSFAWDEELLLLSAVISFPGRRGDILAAAPVEQFRNPLVKNLLKKLCEADTGIDSVLASLGDEEKKLVTRLSLNPGFDLEHVDRNIEDCTRKIAMRRFDERSREIEGTCDPELLNSLLLERRRMLKEAR